MATFTLNINSFSPSQLGVSAVDDCIDTTGINTSIFYTGSTNIINDTTLYTDEALSTVFIGDPLLYYIGTGSNINGTLDLTTTTVTNYIFNIGNVGVVSNISSCIQ